jgi:VacB/RNase II family 3'-5' exoribonuclease
MAQRRTTISGGDLSQALTTLRQDLALPAEFPPEVQSEAEKAAAGPHVAGHVDATDLELVTLDPAGSRDLDQAFALSRRSAGGYDFAYAIADVAAFVAPGGAIDGEAHARGETLYLPDGRIPLHPPVLSEGAASLLPGADRPAVLWRLQLDADGEPTSVDVRRSIVRSRAQLDYVSLQQQGGDLVEMLRELGSLRQQRERDRGGVSLAEPEQQVERAGDGWELSYRAPLPVEDYNAQLSLLTGMAAAKLMLDGKVGLLRTMPPPSDETVASLRRSASALGIDWPKGAHYVDVVRRLDPKVPAQAAMIRLAAVLFRGASYVAFDGDLPQLATHAAVAASYAHATAPLRRLADRYVSETCLALCAGQEVPGWVRDALPGLPEQMAEADRRAHEVDRAVIDLAEALMLQDRVGEVFCGVVVEAGDKGGSVQLSEPAVRARLTGAGLPLGEQVDVRVTGVDVVRRRVEFALA